MWLDWGLEARDYEKVGKSSQLFNLYLGALSFLCRISISKLLIKVHQFFAHTLPPLPLILLHSLAVFFHLRLLGFTAV
jgi:hypothetical protein